MGYYLSLKFPLTLYCIVPQAPVPVKRDRGRRDNSHQRPEPLEGSKAQRGVRGYGVARLQA